MKVVLFKRALMVPVVLTGLFASANAFSATIDISTWMTNANFEGGNGPIAPGDTVGCPNSWSCLSGNPTPGFTSYLVTSAQYTAGSDGLASGIVPNGTHAAYSPTVQEGSGTLFQSLSGTYTFGNTYVLNLWVGTPLVDLVGNPNGPAQTITAYFTYNGTNQAKAISITAPAAGQWAMTQLVYTPGAGDNSIGQTAGFELFADSGGNDEVANFDIGTVSPEPASLLLAGLGIAGLGLLNRRRQAAK